MRRVFLFHSKQWTLIAMLAMSAGAYAADLTPAQQAMVERGKDVVSRSLKDPSSAQWRGLYIRGIMLCGEVNAKNAYGGYVGFRRFYAVPMLPDDSKIESADGDANTRAAFGHMCDESAGERIDVPSQ